MVTRLVGLATIMGLASANYRGISRTAALARVLVAVSILALLVAVATITFHHGSGVGRDGLSSGHGGVYGVLQAAGLLFFAFAGYARARHARRGGARAGADDSAGDPAGPWDHRRPVRGGEHRPLVALGPVAARGEHTAARFGGGRGRRCLGRRGRPRGRGGRQPRPRGRPHRAGDGADDVAVARLRPRGVPGAGSRGARRCAAVVSAVLTTDLGGAIGFSSFGRLTYYAIANASAFTQDGARPVAARIECRRAGRLRRSCRRAAVDGRRGGGRDARGGDRGTGIRAPMSFSDAAPGRSRYSERKGHYVTSFRAPDVHQGGPRDDMGRAHRRRHVGQLAGGAPSTTCGPAAPAQPMPPRR